MLRALAFLLILPLFLIPKSVPAVPAGRSLEWDGNGGGRVVFDGTLHASKGTVCTDCHPRLFMMKKETTNITMKEMFTGKTCGGCHNGEKAFDARAFETCRRCHRR